MTLDFCCSRCRKEAYALARQMDKRMLCPDCVRDEAKAEARQYMGKEDEDKSFYE